MAKASQSTPEKLQRSRDRKSRSFCRKAAEVLSRNSALSGAVEGVGWTCYDLQCEISELIREIEALNGLMSDPCYYSPWCCNLAVPSKSGEPWQAIIMLCDGRLVAVPFTFDNDTITFVDAEPKEVENKSGYAYVKDIMGDDMPEAGRAAFTKITRSGGKPLHRFAKGKRSEDGTFQVVIATEYPVRVRARQLHVDLGAAEKVGERIYEVLSHAKGDADLARLNAGAAFVDEHDSQLHLGRFLKADVSDDRKSRGVIEFDGVTELSRTRKEQMEKESRAFVSVTYDLLKFIGDEDIGDGRTGKRFAWEALGAASVDTPADPGTRMNRSMDDAESHCIHCGEGFERAELNDTFECSGCVTAGRKTPESLTRSKTPTGGVKDEPPTPVIDSKLNERRNMETLTPEQLKTKIAEERKLERTAAREDIFKRTAKVTEIVDEWIKDHGMRKNGECGEALRKVANEFITIRAKDEAISTEQLIAELGNRCNVTQANFPAEQYRSKVALGRDWSKYNVRAALTFLARNKGNMAGFEKTFEGEIMTDMRKHADANGGLGFQSEGGFHMPADAPVPYAPNRRRKKGGYYEEMVRRADERMMRDMTATDFTQGGALIPTITMVPYIELLRNRMVLEWAGCRTLSGLSGNIVWPRQISASTPSAIAEVAALVSSNAGFDQLRASPHRVGNVVNWSLQLSDQSLPNLEAIVYEDSAKSLAIKLDYLVLNGSGAGAEPVGILQTPGINSQVMSATPTLQQIIQSETLIRENNIYDEIVFLATSSSRGLLMSAPAAPIGATVTIGQQNCLWVSRGVDDEVMIGRPAMDSQQIPADTLVTGAFEHCMTLMWGGINWVYDQYTLADTGRIRLVANVYIDALVRHAQAITESTGMSQ